MGSLEDTIRKLHQKYKNRPSPLSEQYIRSNANVNIIPTHVPKHMQSRNALIGNFIPPKDTFR
jgi:hypothetical protein